MKPAALRTMAVTEILYVSTDLVANASAFAASINHLSLPLIRRLVAPLQVLLTVLGRCHSDVFFERGIER